MTTYRIVLEGTTLPGFDAESVRPQLASLTKSAEDVAGRLLSGQSSTVKRGVDQATGLRYVEALRRIGVACRAEAETLDIDIDATSTSPPAPQIEKRPDEKFCTECGAVINAKAEICPKCGVRQITIAQQTPPAAPAPSPVQRKWSPGVAALLSLVIPGAGQMYKGKVGAGLLWLLCVAIGYAAMVVPGLILHLICIFNAASGDPAK